MSITPLLFHRYRTAAGHGKMAAAKQRRSAAPPALHRRRGSGVSPSRCVDGHGEKSPCFVYMIAGARSAKRPKNTHNFLCFLQSIPHIFLFVHPQLADRFRRKNQVLNAHNFSLLVLSNFDKPTQPPSCPMVGSLCIFLFSSPCSALLTPSPYECPLCWFLPVTRSVRSLAGTPGT